MDENSQNSESFLSMSEKTVLNIETESSNHTTLLPDFSLSTVLNDSSELSPAVASLTSPTMTDQNESDTSPTKSTFSSRMSELGDPNIFDVKPMNTFTASSEIVFSHSNESSCNLPSPSATVHEDLSSIPSYISESISASDTALLSESNESHHSRPEQIAKPTTTLSHSKLSSESPTGELKSQEAKFRFADDPSRGKFQHSSRKALRNWSGEKSLKEYDDWVEDSSSNPTQSKFSVKYGRGWVSRRPGKFEPKSGEELPHNSSRVGSNWHGGMSKRSVGKWTNDKFSKRNRSRFTNESSRSGDRLKLRSEISEPKIKSTNKRIVHGLLKEEKDRSWIVRAFNRNELQTIVKYAPTDLLNFIQSNLKRFIRTLNIQQKQKQLEFDLVLNILYKITECINGPTVSMACTIIAEVLSERCAQFLLQLRLYSTSNFSKLSNCTCSSRKLAAVTYQSQHNNTECRITSLCAFFQKILETFPSMSWKVLPIIEFYESVQMHKIVLSPDVCKAVETLVDLYKENRELLTKQKRSIKQVKIHHQEWDNSEFRTMSIFPDQNELCTPDQPAKLRPSIVQGSYKDWMHYYDVQFRLLKEDFTAPLRRGICGYIQGLRGRDLRDIRIYRDTIIKKPIATRNGVNFLIKFDISRFRQRNWAHSKCLLHGSLLCLSNDNFKTIFFAIVTDRDLMKLEDGIITVEVPDNTPMLTHYANKTVFTMIESSAYFEASRHIMASLQTAETDTMPFIHYLITNKWDSMAIPHYLYLKESAVYDLSSCLTVESCKEPNSKLLDEFSSDPAKPLLPSIQKCNVTEDHHRSKSTHSINILAEESWYLEKTHLDPSQLNALKTALTQEIALIQGPPGTGKTFIGIKIVQALLANRDQWDNDQKSPILVMCFTNHALDQFLEGILDASQIMPKVIRIGGRSKSQKLEPFNLSQNQKKTLLPGNVHHTKQKDEKDFIIVKEKLEHQLKIYDELLSQKKDVFLTLDEIKQVIHPTHFYQLLDLAQTPEEEKKILEIWLGLWKKTTAQERIEKMSSKMKNTDSMLDQWPDSDIHTDPSDLELQQGENAQAADIVSQQRSIQDNPHGVNLYASDLDTQKIDESPELIDYQGEGIRANSERILDDETDNNSPVINTAEDIIEPEVMINETEITDLNQEIINGLQYAPLKEEEVEAIDNLANVYDKQVKWKLYNYWRKKLSPELQEDCKYLIEKFRKRSTKLQETNKISDKFVLETAEIIGMTTTGVAKYQHVLHMVKPRIVIVEEAAEVLESHIVSALNAGTQHLILIGDHKQLKPKPNEYHLAKDYNMNVSLFERLMLNKFPCASLNIQHRMRPEIADLLRPYIYRDLQDHNSVQDYEPIRGIQKNLFFIQHEHPEEQDDNVLSFFNMFEAQYLVSLCKYLLMQDYEPKQITILTTYIGQLLHIRDLMPKCEFNGVTLQTVDNYQGEENDIILLSLVRCNQEGDIGFLKEDNRVCVSISRAKKGFYCIGNFSMLAEKSLLWKTMIENLKGKDSLGQYLPLCCINHPETIMEAVTPSDFKTYAPEGGCQLNCQYRLRCGHVCTRKCHTEDSEHLNYVCKKPCAKKCPNGHICPNACFQRCGKCVVKVTRNLPICGHQTEMLCYQNPSKIVCKLPCQNTCSQGHNCPLDCYQECKKCELLIPKLIPKCQHIQMVPCYQDPNTFICTVKCSQTCPHDHPCLKSCGESCGECSIIVEKVILECSHKVLLPCSVEPIQSNCTMPCEKILKCGHKCQAKCGKKCTVLCNIKILRQLSCNHYSEVRCAVKDHVKLNLIQCRNKCEKLLPCNHPCQNLCYQSCTKLCEIVVDKIRPCGHSEKIKCYQCENSMRLPCVRRCEQILLCGHPCTSKCGEPCKCFIPIQITLPCGHSCESFCGASQTKICKVKVKKTLSCGHSTWATCGEQNPLCNSKVFKTLPCGHKKKLLCHENPNFDRTKCEVFCKAELACGHRCSGICGECSKKRFHQPCKYGFELQRFCGHRGSVQCVGMIDIHPGKQKKHQANCIHRKCSHKCSSSCLPCEEPCPWTCPHYSCTKLCHEICDRPSCNERCSQQLKCGHQCHGVCGEPCLTVCPECQQMKFTKLLVKPNCYDPQLLYIQLKCDHLFSLNFFDKYVKETASDVVVSPVCCPQCQQPLTSNYRYGDYCKQHLIDKDLVQSTIERITIQHFSEQKAIEFEKRLAILEKIKSLVMRLDAIHPGRPVLYILDSKELIDCLLKTSNQLLQGDYADIDLQEYFLMFLLLNTIEHIFKLFDEDHYDERSFGEWLLYLKQILCLVHTKCRISVQIIKDLSSELFRLSLTEQLNFANQFFKNLKYDSACVVKDNKQTACDNQLLLVQVESFLNEIDLQPLMRIHAEQYMMYSTSLSRFSQQYTLAADQEFPVDFDRLVRDIKESTPPTLKGVWRKCPQGHFYCTPLTFKKHLCDCQECALIR